MKVTRRGLFKALGVGIGAVALSETIRPIEEEPVGNGFGIMTADVTAAVSASVDLYDPEIAFVSVMPAEDGIEFISRGFLYKRDV